MVSSLEKQKKLLASYEVNILFKGRNQMFEKRDSKKQHQTSGHSKNNKWERVLHFEF